jgi:hypothetical protein
MTTLSKAARTTRGRLLSPQPSLLVLRVVLLVFLFSSVVVVVDAHDVIRSVTDLKLDENGKVASHYLLYPESQTGMNVEACREILEMKDVYGFTIAAVNKNDDDSSDSSDSGLYDALFPKIMDNVSSSACRAVCIERGVDHTLASAVMPHKRYESSLSTHGEDDTTTSTFDAWFHDTCKRVEICLLNYHNAHTPVQVYWIHETTKLLQLHMQIDYAEKNTRCFHSFVGHQFQAIDGDSHHVLRKFTVEFAMTYSFGENPASDDPNRHGNLDAEIVSALQQEWTRHDRVKRTFSTLGFAKGRLPNDVFASMGAFYYNNRNHAVREEWGGKGVFVNWWESDASFVQIPWNMRSLWQERLRQLVEDWAGEPVEQTVMYGLRQYQAGARLLTHVDRLSTHAVSLIVNVAQGNLTEPWPVEVHDHANRLHEVLMQPGDVVFYESAKCLHGRNRALRGDGAFYVNLFTHYRPVGDAAWYAKPNPAHTPAPLSLDDVPEGSCHVDNAAPNGIVHGTMDIHAVGKVKCDDARLGINLSPALFTATSARDLEDWWRLTAPPGFTGYRDRADRAAVEADDSTTAAVGDAPSSNDEL